MLALQIHLQGDGAFKDVAPDKVIHVANDAPAMRVAVLEGGLKSGRPSVALGITLPDGQMVIAETSARLLVSAAKAIEAKYPNLFYGE